MSPIDFIIVALVIVAFVAVCIRTRKKGSCGSCPSSGSCGSAHKGAEHRGCPACEDSEALYERLGRGVH